MLHIFSISLNPSSDSESSLSCVSQSIGNAVSTMFANIQFWKRFEDKQSSRCLRHQQFEVSNRLIMMTWNYIECETREVKNWVNWSPVIFLNWNQLGINFGLVSSCFASQVWVWHLIISQKKLLTKQAHKTSSSHWMTYMRSSCSKISNKIKNHIFSYNALL